MERLARLSVGVLRWPVVLLALSSCRFESGGLGVQHTPSSELPSNGGAGLGSIHGSSAALVPNAGGVVALGTSAARGFSGGDSGGSVVPSGGSVVQLGSGGVASAAAATESSYPGASKETSSGGAGAEPGGSGNTSSIASSGGVAAAGTDAMDLGTNASGGRSQTHADSSGMTQAGTGSGGVTQASATSPNGGARCSVAAFGPPERITGLLPDGYTYSSPSLSEDGLSLYFAAAKASDSEEDIYVATRSSRTNGFYPAMALTEINSPAADGAPCIGSDGLLFLFSSTRPGSSGGRDLYSAQRTSVNGLLADVRPLTALNSTADDNFPWIAADGLTLVFSSTRSGATDLFVAKRPDVRSKFSAPVALDRVNTSYREDRAALSRDGLTIYFVSDRSSGLGERDIWYATRSSVDSAFSNVKNLTSVNSQFRDIDVALSADDEEMYFVSKRQGQLEIYRSTRTCPSE